MDSDEKSSGQIHGRVRQNAERENDPDVAKPGTHWLRLWLMSATGLGLGVLGTAAYVMWFSRDMQAYEHVIQAAREQAVPVSDAWSSSAAGRVIYAVPAVAADPAMSASNAASPVGTQPSVIADTPAEAGTARDASATSVNEEGTGTLSPPGAAWPGSHHRAVSPAKPPTFLSRIGSAFHRVRYRHHASEHDQTTYAHS